MNHTTQETHGTHTEHSDHEPPVTDS